MYKILRMPEVKKTTGLARSTIYKKIAEKDFPKPILLSTKAVGWLESDVHNWIERKLQESVNSN